MADTPISSLPSGNNALSANSLLVVVAGNNTCKVTAQQLMALNPFNHWYGFINVFAPPASNNNWSAITVDANAIYNGYRYSNGMNATEISWQFLFSAGNWTISLMHMTGPNRGIYGVKVANNAVGNIQGYSANAVYNVVSSNNVTIAATAVLELKIRMEGKNASSNNYYGAIQGIGLKRY